MFYRLSERNRVALLQRIVAVGLERVCRDACSAHPSVVIAACDGGAVHSHDWSTLSKLVGAEDMPPADQPAPVLPSHGIRLNPFVRDPVNVAAAREYIKAVAPPEPEREPTPEEQAEAEHHANFRAFWESNRNREPVDLGGPVQLVEARRG